ncbi:MAG TPA: flippase [Burkholderiaceae bacterium]|nr:flippase [Burkholderiaceae bacterium]
MSLKRNTAWNLAGTGLPLLLGVFAIPYLIEQIGLEAFGILTLIWTLIGYFSLFDFGLGRALTQQVASSLSSDRREEIPSLVKSGLIFTAVTDLLGGALLAAVAIPLGQSWLNISLPLQHQAAASLFIAAAGIPLTTATAGLRGVLEAYEDFKAVNILRIALGSANFALPVLSVILLGTSLAYIVLTLIAARLAVLFAYWLLVHKRLSGSWASTKFRIQDVKRLLSFGMWMTVSNIISPLMVTADRFLIAAVLGAGAVAYYTVPFEILVRVLVIPGALTSALFPRIAYTLGSDVPLAHMLYQRSLKIVAMVLGVFCAIIAAGSHWGLEIWLDADFASRSWVIASVLGLGVFLNGIAFVPFAAIQAAGNAKITAKLHLIEIIIYVPVLFVGLHFFGLLGAAMAWVARVAIDLMLLNVVAKRLFSEHKAKIEWAATK